MLKYARSPYSSLCGSLNLYNWLWLGFRVPFHICAEFSKEGLSVLLMFSFKHFSQRFPCSHSRQCTDLSGFTVSIFNQSTCSQSICQPVAWFAWCWCQFPSVIHLGIDLFTLTTMIAVKSFHVVQRHVVGLSYVLWWYYHFLGFFLEEYCQELGQLLWVVPFH